MKHPGPCMYIVTVHLPNQDTKANITNLIVSDADYLHYYSTAQIVVRLNRGGSYCISYESLISATLLGLCFVHAQSDMQSFSNGKSDHEDIKYS